MAPAMLAAKQFPGFGDPVVGRDKYKLLGFTFPIPNSKLTILLVSIFVGNVRVHNPNTFRALFSDFRRERHILHQIRAGFRMSRKSRISVQCHRILAQFSISYSEPCL
jgi:hypothetical protein